MANNARMQNGLKIKRIIISMSNAESEEASEENGASECSEAR